MLRDEGVADNVVLEPVEEAGILDDQRPRPGVKAAASGKTFEQREAERREGERLRKQRQRANERCGEGGGGSAARPRTSAVGRQRGGAAVTASPAGWELGEDGRA
jgi:hypothetical protein